MTTKPADAATIAEILKTLEQHSNQLIDLKKDLRQAQKRNAELEKEKSTLQQEKATLENDKATLQKSKSELQLKYTEMQQELFAVRKEVGDLRSEVQSYRGSQRAPCTEPAKSQFTTPSTYTQNSGHDVNVDTKLIERTIEISVPVTVDLPLHTQAGLGSLRSIFNHELESMSMKTPENPHPKMFRQLLGKDLEHATLIPAPGSFNKWKVVLSSAELVWQVMATKRALKAVHNIVINRALTPEWRTAQDKLWPIRKLFFPYGEAGVRSWFVRDRLLVSFRQDDPKYDRTRGVAVTSEAEAKSLLQAHGLLPGGAASPYASPYASPEPTSPTATRKRDLPASAEKASPNADPKRAEASPTRSAMHTD